MIHAIPIIGTLIVFFVSLFISIPFYFLWNWLAPIYFYWLPTIYLDLPFWHVVGLFMLLPILKLFVPKLAYVDTKVEK